MIDVAEIGETVYEELRERTMTPEYEQWFRERGIEWHEWENWRFERSMAHVGEMIDSLNTEVAAEGAPDLGPMGAIPVEFGWAIELAFATGLVAGLLAQRD